MGIVAVYALVVCSALSQDYDCKIEDSYYSREECKVNASFVTEAKGLQAFCLEISDTDRG